MATSGKTILTDIALVEGVLRQVSSDLELALDQPILFGAPRIDCASTLPAGAGQIHISFKIAFQSTTGARLHGAVLAPLPEAMAMGCFLLTIPMATVIARRAEPAPDAVLKDAMLEIANMLGGSINTALDMLGVAGWSARSEGCQGVRANVPPAIEHAPGAPFVIARVPTVLASFPEFQLLMVLPLTHG